MNLGELKQRTYKLIEEYTNTAPDFTTDPDYSTKFNTVANVILNELNSLVKKAVIETMTVHAGDEIQLDEELDRFFLLKRITGVKYSIIDRFVTFKEDGEAKIYYYQYPVQIKEDSDNNTKIDLEPQAIECMIWGIASDILKMDVSNQYGAMFSQRYAELKSQLDNRINQGNIHIEGGINV
jgi:hypothetical protein